jgi:hypothetical protein
MPSKGVAEDIEGGMGEEECLRAAVAEIWLWALGFD